jgi:tetratricopeptide (TPR) repeat protein
MPQQDKSMHEARRRLDDAQARATAAPADGERMRDLSRALIGLGDALKISGDLSGALIRFREGCGIAHALAGEDADSAWLSETAGGLEKIGETMIAQGDLAGALEGLRQALDVRRRLCARDPDNTHERRNVAKLVARVGEVLTLKSTLTSFRAGVGQTSASAPGRAGGAEQQLRASWSLKTAGVALASRGDTAGALALHRECLAIRRDLVARDPDDVAALLDLTFSLHAVGGALEQQGDFSAALAAYEEALAVRRTLAAREPGNSGRSLDVSWTLMAVGGVRERKGDIAGALEAYRQSLVMRRALSAAQPGNDGLRCDVAFSLIKSAGVLEAAGDMAGALAAYGEARDVMAKFSPSAADEAQWRSDLAALDARIAGAAARQ